MAAVENKRKLQRYVEVLELTLYEYIVLVMGNIIARANKSKGKSIESEWGMEVVRALTRGRNLLNTNAGI